MSGDYDYDYEDDFTDVDEEEERGSSKGALIDNGVRKHKSAPRNKPFTAFQSQASVPYSSRSDRKSNMARQGQARVRSSKRRQALSIRNQYNELTINYEDVLKENKILKQIQKRQERELDKYTNADEDLPRLLDANSYEIAGLKAKSKQLLFEKRELDDKLRRQHQEIMSLKDANKKLQNLANNKKLGEREKLEMDLTTARVTIAHQENKIQDLTKAVEIYKKTADREVKGNTLQLKKTQKNLRELQDAYNELFIKYKAKEKEAGNQNIYAQRARQLSVPQRSKRSLPHLKQSLPSSTAENTPRSTTRTKKISQESSLLPQSRFDSTPGSRTSEALGPIAWGHSETTPLSPLYTPAQSEAAPVFAPLHNRAAIYSADHGRNSFEAMESELEEQAQSLAAYTGILDEGAGPAPRERTRSVSTLASDSEDDDLDDRPNVAAKQELTPKPQTPLAPLPSVNKPADVNVKSDFAERERKEAEERKKEEEKRRLAEIERLKAAEERKKLEDARRQAEEKRKREEEERRLNEEREAARRKEEEEEEGRLAEEKRKKDAALKEKLAALKKNTGGDDFMSQLKASKKSTPVTSPSSSVVGSKSPGQQTTPNDRLTRNSGSGDELRKTVALNNTRRKKSTDDTAGYQPSFVKPKLKTVEKKDPLGLDINEYTPSFSNNNRISRESVNTDKQWAPAGRASVSERNGLFENAPNKPLLRRRSSQQKNTIARGGGQSDFEDDLEELML